MLTMVPQAIRDLNSDILTVPTLSEAVRWYRRGLGAVKVWGSGRVVELAVEENRFRIGLPRKPRRSPGAENSPATARVHVYVQDPDFLVEYAAVAGADGRADPVREREAPWGTQRRGGFTDPFGHSWVVSDRSPLRWHGPGRTHHLGYVQAVVDELAAQGIKTGLLRDESTDLPAVGITVTGGEVPKRAAATALDDALLWTHLRWADSADLCWDEEYGWTVTIEHEPGAVRGRAYMRYEIGGGLVSDPATVASRLRKLLENGGSHAGSAQPRRSAPHPSPELETWLAFYLPT
jgi:uncharacterized glyoxalase superfamily protein PhnB